MSTNELALIRYKEALLALTVVAVGVCAVLWKKQGTEKKKQKKRLSRVFFLKHRTPCEFSLLSGTESARGSLLLSHVSHSWNQVQRVWVCPLGFVHMRVRLCVSL